MLARRDLPHRASTTNEPTEHGLPQIGTYERPSRGQNESSQAVSRSRAAIQQVDGEAADAVVSGSVDPFSNLPATY